MLNGFAAFNRNIGRGDLVLYKTFRKKIDWPVLMLAAWFSLTLTLGPVREVRAAIPLLTAVTMFAKTPFGKAVVTSLLIHAGVLSVEFHNQASASPPVDDTNKKLEVKLNPKDPMSTPSGWTAPSGGNAEPTPPSAATASSGVQWSVGGGVELRTSPDKQTAMNAWCSVKGQTFFAWQGGAITAENQTGYCTNGYSYNATKSTVVACPTGYSVSGANCVLSDASVVQKPADGKAEIKRVGNVLYVDARDTADGLPPNTTVTADTATFTDSFGNTWETKINADGTSTVTEVKARTDGSNKTDKMRSTFSAPDPVTGAVELVGASATIYSGTGVDVSPTADPASDGGSSDAKDSTLQAIKGSIDAENAKVDADRSAADASAAGLPGQLDGLKAAGQDTVGGLGLPTQGQFGAVDVTGVGNALPSNAGECVGLDVSLPQLGNLHIAPCAVVSAVGPLVDFLIIALGVAGGIFVLLGKREEA